MEPPAKRMDLGTQPPAPLPEINPPNNILFVQNLPDDCTDNMLEALFAKCPGFKEVKMPKKSIAFIFYDSIPSAGFALTEYQRFKIAQDKSLVISFAKK